MNSAVGLATLLHVDQRVRWQRGDRVPVETYLEQYPLLQADPTVVLDLISSEMALRRQRGDVPRLADYVRRFGQWETQLRARFGDSDAWEDALRTQKVAVGAFS